MAAVYETKAINNNSNNSKRRFNEGIAGLTAGSVTTLVAHPFDLVKVRLQLDQSEGKARRTLLASTIRHIAYKESLNSGGGVEKLHLAPFYRGLSVNLVGNALSWGGYFFLYDYVKSSYSRYRIPPGEDCDALQFGNQHLATFDYLASASIAGLIMSICTNPIWVLKTRIMATPRPGISYPYKGYNGMIDGIKHIYKSHGIPGFYRGFLSSLFGVGQSALQFMVYERLKQYYNTRDMTIGDYLVCSGLSKSCASLALYPYQVIRARVQSFNTTTSTNHRTLSAIYSTYTHQGIAGFYRGLIPNLARVLPSTCVTFVVYEKVRYLLNQ